MILPKNIVRNIAAPKHLRSILKAIEVKYWDKIFEEVRQYEQKMIVTQPLTAFKKFKRCFKLACGTKIY